LKKLLIHRFLSEISRQRRHDRILLPSSPAKLASEVRLREEEKPRDKLEELGNSYYSDPGGDIHDTIMCSIFLCGSRYFHYSQSIWRLHVIDLERYFNTQDPLVEAAYPRLGDAIATILSHTNRACVEDFLDPRVEEFVYRRELDRSTAGSILVVRRNGNAVIVSFFIYILFSFFCFFDHCYKGTG
jgi:hypothetical protein